MIDVTSSKSIPGTPGSVSDLEAPNDAEYEARGVLPTIADRITTITSFAVDEGWALYWYDRGVYKAKGLEFVERLTKLLTDTWAHEKRWTPDLGKKIAKRITDGAGRLWAQPPEGTLNLANGLLDIETRERRPHVSLWPIVHQGITAKVHRPVAAKVHHSIAAKLHQVGA